MIQELDRIVLTKDLPELRLEAGDIGTVVLVHGNGAGFEVEFTNLVGETLGVVTVLLDAVRHVPDREVAHAREVR